jgi:hypothetical protein
VSLRSRYFGLLAAILAQAPARNCHAADAAVTADENSPSPTAFAEPEPRIVLDWGTGNARSFLVPAYEIPAFQLLLNRFDHYAIDAATYPSPITNFRENLHRQWIVDNDKFSTNQFLHPYQGSVYQGLARSAGLGFWEASAYTFGGSLLWEQSGENTAPSINDQIATGIGGNFLGEPLFRLSSLVLETCANWRLSWPCELGAAVISPATGFNRLVYGKRFSPVFRSYDPAVFARTRARLQRARPSIEAPPLRLSRLRTGCPASQATNTTAPLTISTSMSALTMKTVLNPFSAAVCFTELTTPPVVIIAVSGVFTGYMTTQRPIFFAFRTPQGRWERRRSGGSPTAWRCKARCWRASDMQAAESSMARALGHRAQAARVYETIITA